MAGVHRIYIAVGIHLCDVESEMWEWEIEVILNPDRCYRWKGLSDGCHILKGSSSSICLPHIFKKWWHYWDIIKSKGLIPLKNNGVKTIVLTSQHYSLWMAEDCLQMRRFYNLNPFSSDWIVIVGDQQLGRGCELFPHCFHSGGWTKITSRSAAKRFLMSLFCSN